MTDITSDNFDYVVSKDITIVDFWAPYCVPCQKFIMQLPALHAMIYDRAKIVKYNIATPGNTKHKELGIKSIPTCVVFKDGVEIDRWSGVLTNDEIKTRIDSLV